MNSKGMSMLSLRKPMQGKSLFKKRRKHTEPTPSQTQNPRRELTDRNIPFWDTHSAKKLLENDVADGTANAMASKKQLWQSRDEYQKFPLSVFRDHFYQERRKQLAGPYWQRKRNLAAQKEHDKEVREMKDEWHENIAKDVEDMLGELDLGA